MRRIIQVTVGAVIAAAVVAAVLFQGETGGYLRALLTSAREEARRLVPLQLEIQRARGLNQEILADTTRLLERYSQEEVAIEERESAAQRNRKSSEALKQSLMTAKAEAQAATAAAGNGSGDVKKAERSQARLAAVFREYTARTTAAEYADKALAARKDALLAMHDRIISLSSQRAVLDAECDRLEACLQTVRATHTTGTDVDDAVGRARQAIGEVDHRIRVLTRVAENTQAMLPPPPGATNELPADESIVATVDQYLREQDAKSAPSKN